MQPCYQKKIEMSDSCKKKRICICVLAEVAVLSLKAIM